MHWVTPFVEAGAGGLVFSPRNIASSSTQLKAAFLYGGGVDLAVTHGVFVRAAYRGLVYSSPTFHDPANAGFGPHNSSGGAFNRLGFSRHRVEMRAGA